MADRSSQSITVNASAAEVMAVIGDFASYPQWARSIRRAEVEETGADGRAKRVQFVVDAGPIKDEYTLEYDWAADDSSVSWQLVAPSQVQKRQEGSYELTEDDGGTTVTYTLSVETGMPMLGMLRRKGEKMIMDTALKELKKRVEG